METQPGIRWPARFAPSQCAVHVRNELGMSSPPEVVWAWLIRASLWPQWYPNSADVTFLSGAPPDLAEGTRWRWRTFGVTIESRVLEFVPLERIGWEAHAFGVHAYHAWLLQRTPEGCRVVTEETQNGGLVRLGKRLMPARMSRFHQLWLERLREQAATGLPPDTSPQPVV